MGNTGGQVRCSHIRKVGTSVTSQIDGFVRICFCPVLGQTVGTELISGVMLRQIQRK